jgi:phosphohistidine swiveling domain-containing protein
MNGLIYPLNSKKKSARNISLVGGKAANLIKLNQIGYRTAPGFVITTAVFNSLFQKLKLREDKNHRNLTISQYDSFLENIVNISFDAHIENAIRKKYAILSTKVAVRSSMPGEDQTEMSFAGQLDTFLNIDGGQLIDAIKKCYASVFKPQIQNYIKESGVQSTNVFAMAVIVQQMVPAICSGIAFTADPICGRREVIIEAHPGTGQDLVAGSANPDRYVVNANEKISELQPVIKDHPLLTEVWILQLARLANQIAGKMDFPQDIEWAWDGSNFIFLQTRPISTLAGKNIYSSNLMADMSPGLLKPLQWSTNALAMSTGVFGRLFTEIIGPNNIDFSKSIRLIHSRVYANLTFYEQLFRQIGLPGNFFEMIARDESGIRRRPKINAKLLYTMVFRLLPCLFKYSRAAKQMNAFISKQDTILNSYRKSDWNGISIGEKFEHTKKMIHLHNDAQWNIIVTALNMTIRNSILKKIVRKFAPMVEPSDLIKGLSGLQGMEPNKELASLSQLLKNLGEDAIQVCIDGNDEEIREKLLSSTGGKVLIEQFDIFMQRFGHLSANTTNFTEIPWIENPELIWSSIAGSALNQDQKHHEDSGAIREEKKNEVLTHLNMPRKLIFQHLLKSTITYLILREKISLLLSDDTYQFRRLILSLGHDLVEKGVFYQADDIFYLFYDELENLVKNPQKYVETRPNVKKRREQIRKDASIIPEDTICGDRIITRRNFNVIESEFLSGLCGSSGLKKGYAYVVNDPGSVDRNLSEDDILVVPYTHVGWTPLFTRVGGIIAQTGGQLSHTSIIARECGIPAIVNVSHVMQSIKTGQELTLDADSGRVYLKHLDLNKGAFV